MSVTNMIRPRVSVFLALSLDGHIAGENNDLSWLEPYSTDPPEETGYTALMNAIDVMILGRNSYDVVLALDSWLYEGKKVMVMTHRPLVSRHGEEAWSGSLSELLRNLVKEGCKHAYLDGGHAVRQGLEADVVDELTISWVPVILGKGVPLFTGSLSMQAWKLQGWSALPSGLLQGKYLRDNNILHEPATK